MNMDPFSREEDLVPREFTHAIERPWGTLFLNEENPDSYDSNHALLYRNRVKDLSAVLDEISDFYLIRGIQLII